MCKTINHLLFAQNPAAITQMLSQSIICSTFVGVHVIGSKRLTRPVRTCPRLSQYWLNLLLVFWSRTAIPRIMFKWYLIFPPTARHRRLETRINFTPLSGNHHTFSYSRVSGLVCSQCLLTSILWFLDNWIRYNQLEPDNVLKQFPLGF